MEQTGDFEAQLASTRQRVTGLEQTLQSFQSSITAQLSALSTKLDERSRTPWATIFAAMGVVLSVVVVGGGLAMAPLAQSIVRLERDADNAVTTDRLKEFKDTYESNRLVSRQELDAKFAALASQIAAIDAAIVPRGENEEHWRGIASQAADIQRQLDDLKKTFGDTFSLRDALQQMQARIDKLEAERLAGR